MSPLLGLALAAIGAAGPRAQAEAGCLVCHRAATRSLLASSHAGLDPGRLEGGPALPRFVPEVRPRRESACVACHGPEASHVEDAKARRYAPGAYPIPAGACVACHADPQRLHRGVREFRPERSCEGCHRVHVPRQAAGSVAAGEHEGEEPAEGSRVGPFAISGFADFGIRGVRVSGSEDQYEQDVNLDPGARLLGGRIEGRAVEDAPVDSFVLAVRGLSDPHRAARAEAAKEGRWKARADWSRDEYVFATPSDFHRRDGKREEVEVAVSNDPALPGDPTLGFDYAQTWRRGDERGTLLVIPFLIFPADTLLQPPNNRVKETGISRTVGGNLRFELGGFGVFVRPEWREHVADARIHFQGSAPVAAGVAVSERDLDEEIRNRAPAVTARAARSFLDGAVNLDAGFRYEEAEVDSDLHESLAGTTPGGPFTSQTDAHGSSRSRRSEFDVEGRVRPLEGAELRLRALRREEDVRSRLLSNVFVTPPGFPIPFPFRTSVESIVEVAQAELRVRAAPFLDLRIGGEGFRQRLDYVGATFPNVAPPPDRMTTVGPSAGATVRPARGWTLDLDFQTADASDTLYEIQPEEAASWRVRLRGRVSSDLLLQGWVRRQTSRVEDYVGEFGDRLDVDQRLDAAALTLDWRPHPDFGVSAGYARQSFDRTADAAFAVAGATTQGESDVEGIVNAGTFSFLADLTDRLRARSAIAYERASGDSAFRFQDLSGALEYDLTRRCLVGTELRYVEYEPHGNGPETDEGYDALLALLFARVSF